MQPFVFVDGLLSGDLKKIVLVLAGVESGETLERWVFNVEMEETAEEGEGGSNKELSVVHGEIQAIIRQITASVTFLPLLSEQVSFDLLAYTDRGTEVPLRWEESEARLIEGGQHVKLRSFSTGVHRVEGMVAFREGGDV